MTSKKQTVNEALGGLGFAEEHTGGNCMAYFRYLGTDEMEPHLVITEGWEAQLPSSWDSELVVGRYESCEHGEPSAYEEYESVRAFVDAVRAGKSNLVPSP